VSERPREHGEDKEPETARKEGEREDLLHECRAAPPTRARDGQVRAGDRSVEAVRDLCVAFGGGVADKPRPRLAKALDGPIGEAAGRSCHLGGLDVGRSRKRCTRLLAGRFR